MKLLPSSLFLTALAAITTAASVAAFSIPANDAAARTAVRNGMVQRHALRHSRTALFMSADGTSSDDNPADADADAKKSKKKKKRKNKQNQHQVADEPKEEEKNEVSDKADEPVAEVASEPAAEPATETETEATPEPTPEPAAAGATVETASTPTVAQNLQFLQSLGAITSRGEFASPQQRKSAQAVLATIEAGNPTSQPANDASLVYGTWELVYSTTELFRSSPFFMAGRAVCTTDAQRDQYNWFCDMHRKALAISNIGPVRQIIAPGDDGSNRLVSEFEVKAGAVPFLSDLTPFRYSGGMPATIDGAIVSSADWNATATGDAFELYMDTVEIKGSNLPGLRQLFDTGYVKLQSRSLADFLENNVAAYTTPRPIFRTTYLDETFRISRDQDGNAFLYVKTSTNTAPTDYSDIDADLGVGKLLQGFNDAVTRFYP